MALLAEDGDAEGLGANLLQSVPLASAACPFLVLLRCGADAAGEDPRM